MLAQEVLDSLDVDERDISDMTSIQAIDLSVICHSYAGTFEGVDKWRLRVMAERWIGVSWLIRLREATAECERLKARDKQLTRRAIIDAAAVLLLIMSTIGFALLGWWFGGP